MSCNHYIGVSVCKVTKRDTQEVITSWTNKVHQSDLPVWWDGETFKFCPECGANVEEIVNSAMAVDFRVTDHQNGGEQS